MPTLEFEEVKSYELRHAMAVIDARCGVSATNSLMAQLGLTRRIESIAGTTAYNIAVARLVLLAQTELNLTDIAFEIARRATLADLGLIGYAMLTAPTFGDAMSLCLRINKHIAASTKWDVLNSDDAVIIRFSVHGALSAFAAPYLEQWMAIAWTLQKQLRPEIADGELKSVHISYRPTTSHAHYRNFYNRPVQFEHDYTELVYRTALLSQPIAVGNAIANEVLANRCDDVLARLRREGGVVDTLRRELASSTHFRSLDLETAACRLGLSPRTLRRRLHKQGTNFKTIVNELKMTTARDYLQNTNIPIDEIAFMLGYSQSSAFYRSFKRWYGHPPSTVRKSLSV